MQVLHSDWVCSCGGCRNTGSIGAHLDIVQVAQHLLIAGWSSTEVAHQEGPCLQIERPITGPTALAKRECRWEAFVENLLPRGKLHTSMLFL
jgi:hypothetical protein